MVQNNDSGPDGPKNEVPENGVPDIVEELTGEAKGGGLFGGRPPLPLIGGLGVAVLIGIILIVVALSSGNGDDGDGSVAVGATPTSGSGSTSPTGESGGLAVDIDSTVEATIDLDRPTVIAPSANPTSVSAGDKLVIPKFNVDAPLTLKSVALDGVMPNPNGPDDVAFYDFSAWPGKGGSPGRGGNAIFSGHVDSGGVACSNGTVPPPCQAVLWDLNRLQLGDEIQVHLEGTIHRYRVTSNQPVSATTGPWDQIVSSTAEESLTIITCGGNFNRETREYTNRQVVTAVKI